MFASSPRGPVGPTIDDRLMAGEASVLDPGRLWDIGRRRWPWFVLVPLVFALAAGLYASRQPSRFEAEALVALQQTAAEAQLLGRFSDSLVDRTLRTEEELINGDAMANLIDATLGRSVTYSAEAIDGTDLLAVTAEDATPAGAASTADRIVELYIERRREAIIADLQVAIDSLGLEIEGIEGRLRVLDSALVFDQGLQADDLSAGESLADGRLRETLESQLAARRTELEQLQSVAALTNGGVRVAAPAVADSERVAPNPRRTATLWGLLGILTGVAAAWARERVDGRIRSSEDLSTIAAQVDYLGTIPKPDTRALAGPASLLAADVADRFRLLSTNLFANGNTPYVVQVAGLQGGEGATFVAANLAVTLSVGGWATVLVDADMINGDVHEIFGTAAKPGTKQLLAGERLTSVIQNAPQIRGLGIVARGSAGRSDASLHSTALTEMLDGLTSRFEVVVVDGPPMAESGEASVLASHVDGTVLVGATNETTTDDLNAAAATINRVGGRLSAVVLTTPGRTVIGDNRRSTSPRAQRWPVDLRRIG